MSALVVLSLALRITGEPSAVCPDEPIEAVQGADVELQCWLDPTFNLSAHTVEWQREDLKQKVHVIRHGHDDPNIPVNQYRNRTTVSREGLSRGVMTLRISSAQQSDSGKYRCACIFNSRVPPPTNCTVDLDVSVKENKTQGGNFSTTGPSVQDVTEPAGAAVNTGSVAAAVFAAVAVFAFIIFILKYVKKYGKSQVYKMFRWKKAPKAENEAERRNLRTRPAQRAQRLA